MTQITIVSDYLGEIAANEEVTEESIIKNWLEFWEDGIDQDILVLDTTFLSDEEAYTGYGSYKDLEVVCDGHIYTVMELLRVQMFKLLDSGKTVIGLMSTPKTLKDKRQETIAWSNYHWLPFIDHERNENGSFSVPIRKNPDPERVKVETEFEGLETYFINAGWTDISINPVNSRIDDFDIVASYDFENPNAEESYDFPSGIIVNSWETENGRHVAPDGQLVLLPKPFSLKVDIDNWFSSIVSVGAALSTEDVGHDQLGRIIGRSDSESLQNIYRIFERLPQVQRQLQQRYDDRPTINIENEYDLQDLTHSLLRLYFNDIRDEEWAPSYADTSPRIDFLLKQETIAIELKMTRANRSNENIRKELIEDKEYYQTHPDVETLVCYVYDPQYLINNPVGFENDISDSSDELSTEVLVSSSNRFT
jgi:hypothetical protein